MNNNQLRHLKLSLLVMFGLTACGGGGGGGTSDNSSDSVNPTITPTPTTKVEVTKEPSPAPSLEPQSGEQTTQNLIAPPDFDFAPDQQVTLQVELNELSGHRAYFSLYQSYNQDKNGSLHPVYASRIVATNLTQGKLTTQLSLTKTQTSYLAEIWFYDGQEPLQQIIQVEQNQLIWQ